ncbi:uncharacterized protein LOC107369887 [Tetranychus urticae]|uniref:Uncharacterized protein n=1 Tax=Tetranychus urticae TaxID=32264 RepID=T1L384_TETUR|nr:uncharacterized protein LOC107369887 [Tetranychus urticae]
MAQNHDGSDKVTIKMKILGDATYDIVIDWLDDDCHPDVQVKRQLASITQTPFVYIRSVLFFLDELDLRASTRPDWTRKSSFMNRFIGQQYVLKFRFHIGTNNDSLYGRLLYQPDYFIRYELVAEHLVDENECTINFCPFIYNISNLKQSAKLANNNELKAKLVQEWIGFRINQNFGRHIILSTLRRHNVLNILYKLTCKLEQDHLIHGGPYLRTNG